MSPNSKTADHTQLVLRLANNADQAAIVELISQVYAEYGEQVNLDDAELDLTDITRNYFGRSGAFWVLVDGETIVGTHAAYRQEDQPDHCTFRRLYLHPTLRGGDWGTLLMQNNIDWAKENGFRRVEFWSDVRFKRAHAFFAKFGFERDGRVRTMHDAFEPYDEYFFFLSLDIPEHV